MPWHAPHLHAAAYNIVRVAGLALGHWRLLLMWRCRGPAPCRRGNRSGDAGHISEASSERRCADAFHKSWPP